MQPTRKMLSHWANTWAFNAKTGEFREAFEDMNAPALQDKNGDLLSSDWGFYLSDKEAKVQCQGLLAFCCVVIWSIDFMLFFVPGAKLI